MVVNVVTAPMICCAVVGILQVNSGTFCFVLFCFGDEATLHHVQCFLSRSSSTSVTAYVCEKGLKRKQV